MRSLGISELRLCARGARGRLGCSSDQVPAPRRCFQVLSTGWETHRLLPEPGLLGGEQPAGLGTHLLPEKDPASAPPLRSRDSGCGPRERGSAPPLRGSLRLAASLIPRNGPPARAKVTAPLWLGPLGAASAASAHRRRLYSLLPAHTRGALGRDPWKNSVSSRSCAPRLPLLWFWAYPEGQAGEQSRSCPAGAFAFGTWASINPFYCEQSCGSCTLPASRS